MGLRDVGASLPPGFRFCPSDDELVCHYLYNKVSNDIQHPALRATTLLEIDLHKCEPWQLPEVTKLNAEEWYFFSFCDRKYATGSRTNRATTSGYWKATGKDKLVHDPRTHVIVGMRKTLVFYRGRAPNGIKTGWIMHEFRLENPHIPPQEDWVLCRVFLKNRGENKINNNTDNCNNICYGQNMLVDTKGGVTSTAYDQPLCHSISRSSPGALNQSTTTILNLTTMNPIIDFQTFQDPNNVVTFSDDNSKYEHMYEFLLDGVSGCLGEDMSMLDQHSEDMGFDLDNSL
ncbi:NAC domain-containing protein 21/22-like [Impatiens glandulifera]|uniref:NAC domain-containing protein 21/22-like n=1 Tax=Impatiens glandulifera TaxID=253017 RepID=UPI001FB15F25|nr:NAC domain-containing protein 21/22-like [Impatiens glandulifera]